MKGIVHFIAGIAAASFLPGAVSQAADGSLVLVLGGLFGLLPDTIDFRFARYLETPDHVIDPEPYNMQPQVIAARVAGAARTAFETGQPQTVRLHTIRVSAHLWRAYSLRFNPPAGEIVVRVGPVVDTSGLPLPGSEPAEEIEGRASAGVPMRHTYDEEIPIDAFSGPSFRFERRDGQVQVTFLPWHRRWSHSLILAAAIGLALGVLLGPLAGLTSGLGYAAHILTDQLGFMGSNLLWPLTGERTRGLRLLRSGDPLPNFISVWLAAALILFNLDRFSGAPRLPVVPYLVVTVLLPLLVLGVSVARRSGVRASASAEALIQGEALSETDEAE